MVRLQVREASHESFSYIENSQQEIEKWEVLIRQ